MLRIQQWFRTLFAKGGEYAIRRSVHLVLRLAADDADALSVVIFQRMTLRR